MQCDQPVDRGEPGRGEQGHGPHLPQVGGTRAPGHLRSPFFPQWTSLFQLQDAPWCLCWYSSLQLPSYDPSLDVPNGPHLWQHLHNEGLKLERVTLILDHFYNCQPSERDPTACMALVELLKEAGGENETIRNRS